MKNALDYIPLAGRLILALGIGTIGGAIFWMLSLPLPWMLGAISATMLAALSGMPIGVPHWIRPPLAAIIGTMLGSGFPSDVLQRAADWIVPIGGLVIYLLVAGAACVWYFYKVCGYDFKTAYFCGMPGGLVEMTLLGESYGADARRIAFVHTARILLVVFMVSGATRYFFVNSNAINATDLPEVYRLSDLSWQTVIWVAATSVVGATLARLLRMPAGFLLGPMLISATLHVSAITDFEIPREIVYAAQIGLGTTIGCRFLGQSFREAGRMLTLCLGSTAILLSLTLLFSWGVHFVTGLDALLLVLAYAPGGLAEFGLIALFLHLDTAFVACHHLVRVVLVGFSAGYIFRWFGR